MSDDLSGWNVYQLGQLIERGSAELQTGPFGTMLNSSEYTVTGTPVIAVQDICENKLSHHKFVYVNESTVKRLSRYKVKKGDIIFGRKGAVERRAIIKKSEDGWLQGSDCIRLRFDDSIDATFISYQFGSESHREWMLQFANGATMPSLNQQILKLLPIRLPPLPEQKAIANVLSSLDDKIDLLHRQNKTLESMAETLFRQWFVEEAQEEWETRPLSTIAKFLNGLACQKYPPQNGFDRLPVLKIKELSSGITELSDWATSKVKPEYIVEFGDVIFAWSATLMVKVWNGGRCVLNQHLFKLTSADFPKWFYLMWCKHHLAEFISISSGHATTMGHIKRGDLDAAMVIVPSEHELTEMSKIMNPILENQIANAKQIKSLEKLRDALLPKLMSGDVRIKN
jgi:type I restriction enzyme, S subunit